MASFNKLDNIEIYTLSLKLTTMVYKLTRKSQISRDYTLVNQLRSACLSVPANIAEGYGRRTKKDFAQFLSIALGSSNEIISYLDFISLEYKLNIIELKNSYNILAKKIYNFRLYLLSNP